MTNAAPNAIHTNVVPSEVGWQFVPQYYTFVNKQPDYLHRFYTKKSTFIHGTEGEDGKPCNGQQEIHAKITSLGFQDCKVFIHSVDAQSSADGGIIIQVIGEMSNAGGDWKKFVQTFFLAEQPNGYFVLNDIFRFLKEETVEGDDGEAEPAAQQPSGSPAQEPAPVVTTTSTDILQDVPTAPVPIVSMSSASPAPPPPPVEEPSAPVAEPPAEIPVPVSEPIQPPPSAPSPAPVAAALAIPVNGHIQEPEAPVIAAPAPTTSAPSQLTPATSDKSRSPAPPSTTAAPSSSASSASAPSAPAKPPAAAPSPSGPPAPKTWANLAAKDSKKWGAAVSTESRGTTEVIPSSPAPGSGAQTPLSAGPGSSAGGGEKKTTPALQAAQSITAAHVFIKGITEPISQTMLTNHLTSNFGPLKELDIIRSRYCAFGEFQTIDAARRAIIASLPQSQGGQGGIWIEVPGGDSVRVVVDTRKERNDRPPARPRGGAPQGAGEGRGGGAQSGNQGGSGFRGRGRGRGGGPK